MSDVARLFEHFIDPVDGIMCVAADASRDKVVSLAEPYGLRFPLFLDSTAPLIAQVESSGFAPASSRFGPFCDNITGMNWQLASGRIVRVGERVVKSTTGYDLFRFLLHTGGRFGRPLDYVLRLRPACAIAGTFVLTGPELRNAAMAVLADSWMHWFDSVDFVTAGNGTELLRIAVNCPEMEWPVFNEQLSAFARSRGLECTARNDAGAPLDGIPDAVIKTTPDRVLATAAGIMARAPGSRCVALCYPGVVHLHLPAGDTAPERISNLLAPLQAELDDLGGDWHSRHLPPREATEPEAGWLKVLEQEFNIP